MKVLRAWGMGVLALSLVGLAACGGGDDDDASSSATTTAGETGASDGPVEIHIAHIADLTGPAKTSNEAHVRGMDLALDVLAEQGDITIDIERRDTSGDVARATSTMTELANDDSIVWQFGPANTGEFFAAIPIADQLKMPMDSVSSGGVFTDEFNDYTFRTSFAENAATSALLDYLSDDLHASKIAAAYANDNDFSKTSAEYFIDAAGDAGIDVTTKQTFSSQDISYSTQAAEIASGHPDAVYVATNINAGLLIKAIRDAGYDGPIVGTNNTFHTPSNVYDTSGGETQDIYFVSPFDPNDPRPEVQDFVTRFHAKYPGIEPTVQDALGYDSLMILAKAALSVDGDITRESLREAFGNVEYDGVTGAGMTFPDHKGDVARENIKIMTIEAPGVAVAADSSAGATTTTTAG
jgi:branched-chain amino acid transport system substrate-binding protein